MSITNQLPAARPEPEPEPPYRVFRFVASLVTAVIIAGTAYLGAWHSIGDHWYANMGPYMTRNLMGAIRDDIERYKTKNGHLPAKLSDLGPAADLIVDAWGRPFQYEVVGDSYDLYSLGRDGQPGGSRLDADLHLGKVDRDNEHLTLWEFSTHDGIEKVILICILAGLLAFPVALIGEGRRRERPPNLLVILGYYAITAWFALMAAVVMMSVHLLGMGH